MKKRVKIAVQRQEYHDAFKASGETVTQWCKRNGMHRTTVYRWLRIDVKKTAVTALPTKRKATVQPTEAAQIKWLPVTEKSKVVIAADTGTGTRQKAPALIAPAITEIRVQIGSSTVVTPDGFKCETLESVCRTLQRLC